MSARVEAILRRVFRDDLVRRGMPEDLADVMTAMQSVSTLNAWFDDTVKDQPWMRELKIRPEQKS